MNISSSQNGQLELFRSCLRARLRRSFQFHPSIDRSITSLSLSLPLSPCISSPSSWGHWPLYQQFSMPRWVKRIRTLRTAFFLVVVIYVPVNHYQFISSCSMLCEDSASLSNSQFSSIFDLKNPKIRYIFTPLLICCFHPPPRV